MTVPPTSFPEPGQPGNWAVQLTNAITDRDAIIQDLAEGRVTPAQLASAMDQLQDSLTDTFVAQEDTGTAGLAVLAASLPAEAREALGITVDTTVGTRVMLGGHMIYGDTGWRDITSTATGALDPSNAGTIHLRREGSTVSLALRGVSLLPGDGLLVVGPLWQGFWPTTNTFLSSVASASPGSYEANDFIVVSQYAWVARRQLDTGEVSQTRTSDPVIGVITYTTSQPWPSTLPGTPA